MQHDRRERPLSGVRVLDLTRVLGAEPKPSQWKAISRFPSNDIDLAFVAPDSLAAEKVEKAVRQQAGSLLVGLSLFDVYRGKGVPDGSRSLAYRLRLQAPDRTLADADVAQVREKIVAAASARMIVIADVSKWVQVLGRFPLPIEVNIFGIINSHCKRHLVPTKPHQN